MIWNCYYLKKHNTIYKKIAHFQIFICMKKLFLDKRNVMFVKKKFALIYIFQIFGVNFQIHFKLKNPWANDLVIEFPCIDDFPS
jgi:hypothetical protein